MTTSFFNQELSPPQAVEDFVAKQLDLAPDIEAFTIPEVLPNLDSILAVLAPTAAI